MSKLTVKGKNKSNQSNRNYTKKVWYKKLKNSHPKCIYCGEEIFIDEFTVDHVIARADGGTDTKENCKPCCKFCNGLKSDMSLEEFNKRYPIEKILKLKKFTDSTRILNKSEIYQSINDRIIEAFDILQSVQDDYMEHENILGTYRQLSDKIKKEMALDVNLSASNGYKAYCKIRDVERNIIRINSETGILQSFNTKYIPIRSKLLDLKKHMQIKKTSIMNKPYNQLLESDIREQMENNLK
jgi:hypothetical protein